MRILGIESTAHTFGAAIIDDTKILSNENEAMRVPDSGLIPVRIAEHHVVVCSATIERALTKAKTDIRDVDLIAVSTEPGMGHALRVGAICAKALSYRFSIPLMGVNHSLAHLTSALTFIDDERVTLLYVAGANTQIWNYDGYLNLIGETLDIGLGHLLDLVARDLGAGFPGGPIIERLAAQSDELVELPYSVKGMDVTYGGLSTKLRQLIATDAKRGQLDETRKASLAYSLQEHAFAMMLEACERAIALNDSTVLGVIGGVALNKRFTHMARMLCDERGCQLFVPDRALLADNAGMIALEGARRALNGETSEPFREGSSLTIDPYARLPARFRYERFQRR
ncbi:MAG: tRNA (adenosine(37)-N6)-threonylcarbamoyltransferase complex transferase subunit TsaD [Candidatus Woesearchaeota archaeon]